MAEYTTDDALAFIESMRLTVGNRTGFRWLGEKLDLLAKYVESGSADNELMQAFLDESGAREAFEAFRAARTGAHASGADKPDAP